MKLLFCQVKYCNFKHLKDCEYIVFSNTKRTVNLLFYQTLEGQLIYSFNSNMTNSTSGEGTAYPSGLPEFTPINHLFSWRLKWVFLITWHLASVSHHLLTFHILIFWKTTGSNWIRLGCDPPWVVLFQNCVRWPCPIYKMAAMASDLLNNWKSFKIFFSRTTG